jgi:tetratricopeptide (TPR) repeat protein/regulation of enolase protein 1 (concanavalin A-like superfamily)
LEALRGLGRIHHALGKEPEAEACFRQALAVGREIRWDRRQLVRLYWWLADVLYWRSRYDEMLSIAEEGLTLLGDDIQSLEAALMNETVATAHWNGGDREQFREANQRNAQFIESLPYTEELRSAYATLAYPDESNEEEHTRWLQALERRAAQHHDLKALGQVHYYVADGLELRGDLRGAILRGRQALELFMRIGDAKHAAHSMIGLASFFLHLGELRTAEEYLARAMERPEHLAGYLVSLAHEASIPLSFCRGAWEEAVAACRRAIPLGREVGWREVATLWLGRAYLAQGRRQEALDQFRQAITVVSGDADALAAVLSELETASESPEGFRSFCHRFRSEHPEAGASPPLQWYLEPAEPEGVLRIPYRVLPTAPYEIRDTHYATLDPEWVWHDPFGDCSFAAGNGLQMHAANERDLQGLNLSAPRLLRSVAGAFAIQTVCLPLTADQPAMGGILLWKDKENFLRLDRGTRGPHEVSFQGCLGNQDLIIGRGRLPAERMFLRLERQGSRVNALCSVDGQNWFTVGHAEFPVEDPLEVGLHAIGAIDRTSYHGAYPEGTAIRFESFELWTTK